MCIRDRVYTIDGYYNQIEPPGKYLYKDFEANMFWAMDTPCICFPHPQRANRVLIYAHANHEDMWRTSGLLQKMRDTLGCHAVGFEYPGYGIAPGKATEDSCVEALRRVYRHLRDECKFAPTDIILFGRSIGTGICCQFAAKNTVLAVMLMSPFSSIKAVVQSGGGHKTLGGMAASLINDTFRSIDAVTELSVPLLILHGDQDVIVPCRHSEQLYAAAVSVQKNLEIFPGMGHNDVYDDDFRDKVIGRISEFAESLLVPSNMESPKRKFVTGSANGAAAERTPDYIVPMDRREIVVNNIRMVMRSISQQESSLCDPTEILSDPEEVAALAMRTLTKLQIIFEEADVHKRRHLGSGELELLLKAAFSEYCGAPDMDGALIEREVREAFEAYDIKGEGKIEFLNTVEMFCSCSPYQLPIHPDVKLQMRLMASQGGWDGLELRFI
eukprot:TRINITY_DN12154_c0_g1_i5.p1 TRINITY_DN12154_c0_g1~~TRINITY_DN12154_c0_g1_i5.p1  ORF type:complete len:442 (+),score=100.43 TRINITY_DN12154_c0_g1_i5:124-1449(+)